MRQIVLDTETTGLEPSQGHRIIEIGCVELVDRELTGNHYHQYLKPEREIEPQAIEVHGITNEFLKDKPTFAQIAENFLDFIRDSELIIHNAPFDVGFLNHEIKLLNAKKEPIDTLCKITDTLSLARAKHPGQRNSLDALCKRYGVDNSQRQLHGALLDAEILADVFLLMTGGQVSLSFGERGHSTSSLPISGEAMTKPITYKNQTPIIKADTHELLNHREKLASLAKISGTAIEW